MGWYASDLTAFVGWRVLGIVGLQGDFSMGWHALDLTAKAGTGQCWLTG